MCAGNECSVRVVGRVAGGRRVDEHDTQRVKPAEVALADFNALNALSALLTFYPNWIVSPGRGVFDWLSHRLRECRACCPYARYVLIHYERVHSNR